MLYHWLAGILLLTMGFAVPHVHAEAQTPKTEFEVKWNIPPTRLNDDWRPFQNAGPKMIFPILPQRLWVSKTEIRLERIDATIPAGEEFVLAESTKLVACNRAGSAKFGHTNRRFICFVDLDNDGSFDSFIDPKHVSAGGIIFSGSFKRVRGEIAFDPLNEVNPDLFSEKIFLHFSPIFSGCSQSSGDLVELCTTFSSGAWIASISELEGREAEHLEYYIANYGDGIFFDKRIASLRGGEARRIDSSRYRRSIFGGEIEFGFNSDEEFIYRFKGVFQVEGFVVKSSR